MRALAAGCCSCPLPASAALPLRRRYANDLTGLQYLPGLLGTGGTRCCAKPLPSANTVVHWCGRHFVLATFYPFAELARQLQCRIGGRVLVSPPLGNLLPPRRRNLPLVLAKFLVQRWSQNANSENSGFAHQNFLNFLNFLNENCLNFSQSKSLRTRAALPQCLLLRRQLRERLGAKHTAISNSPQLILG